MKPVLVMTDSTSIAARLDRPLRCSRRATYVHFGLESLADDGQQLTRPEFYRLAHRRRAALRPPRRRPAGARSDTPGLTDFEHVIAITAPATLSDIYNTFRLAAEQSAPARHAD